MPPGSAQPDFLYDSFCTSCQSARFRSSCVFAVASPVSVPCHHRVIRALPEPPLPAPVICWNSFSSLKEEPLYEFPLNLGLDDPVPRHMRCFCISAIGIESPKAANLQLTHTCQSFKPELVLESKPDDIISKAPKHKGATFTKNIKNDESLWPAVAKIVRGLGIPCEDDDFHCPMDCDTSENHIENQLKPDNSWLSNPKTIPPHTQLLVKLLSPEAKLPTRGSNDAAGYDLYSCEKIILKPGTRKLVNTGISIATPSTKMYARIALRSGLSVKGLDIGAGVVDSDYRGPIKALLINNSNTPFQVNVGDRMAQLILERIENPKCMQVNALPETERACKGFGPTGINSAYLGCNEPMIVPVRLNKNTTGFAMIDSGASTQFIDLEFAVKNNLPLTLKPKPETLIVVDGRKAESQLTHTCTLDLTLDQHLKTLTFQVTKLAGWNMILGKTWLKRHNSVIDWTKNTVTFGFGYCQAHCLPTRAPQPTNTVVTTCKIAMISRAAFQITSQQEDSQIFLLAMSTIQEDVDPAKHSEYPANLVPEQYHNFLPLFTKKGADKLPPHRYVDHEIPLEADKKPPMGRMYFMSATELQEIRKWIEENPSKGFIRASSSFCALPILFVKKKDGSLRLCVDYRALNDITIKDRYPLPCIEETLNQIRGAKYFTRLDLRSAYNLIRIKEGDEWKTAFRTRYGLIEFLVMPFGLTNAPATCQCFVNDTLREFLDVFCVCYLDDILIYSDNLQDHRKQVKAVLEKLHVAGLFVKPEKCEFEVNKTTFLGFVISQEGIEMDLEKVSAVLNWEVPKTIQDVQYFLGFANFYRRFIEGYSRICTPLFNLLKTVDKSKETSTVTTNPDVPVKKETNKAPIEWTPCCQQVFDELKSRFCSAPVLKHFDPTLETILETDASDYVVSGVLSQRHPDPAKPEGRGTLHPVAFLAEKMSPAECNYGTGDKELLVIIACLQKWHMYLHGVPFLIYTDHHNLQNFGTKALLNRRQARWAGLLAQYEFQIQFRCGKANGKADALTRRSGDLPKEGNMRGCPFQEILDPVKFSNFSNPVLCNTAIKHNSDICTALA